MEECLIPGECWRLDDSLLMAWFVAITFTVGLVLSFVHWRSWISILVFCNRLHCIRSSSTRDDEEVRRGIGVGIGTALH